MTLSFPSLPFSGRTTDVDPILAALARSQACVVSAFPRDVDKYMELVHALGTPLPNYGQGQDACLPMYSLHPCINRVMCFDRSSQDKYLHEQGGPLSVHTARSWRHPRPRFFVMLMVNPGFRSLDADGSGWSLLVRWSEAHRMLSAEDPEGAQLLLETPVTFLADHVREPVSNLPIVFRRADGTIGARIRGPFESTWRALQPLDVPQADVARYRRALARFIETANRPPACETFPARARDLIILDNDRVGHGRTRAAFRVPGEGGKDVLNQRELWSVCVE